MARCYRAILAQVNDRLSIERFSVLTDILEVEHDLGDILIIVLRS